MALEKDLEEKCRLSAIKYGGMLVKFKSPGNKGVHDRLLFLPGVVVLIEFKKAKNSKVQPLQDWWQAYFERMRIPAYRVWTLTHFNNIIKMYLDR